LTAELGDLPRNKKPPPKVIESNITFALDKNGKRNNLGT
jgi:hypothetical protein